MFWMLYYYLLLLLLVLPLLLPLLPLRPVQVMSLSTAASPAADTYAFGVLMSVVAEGRRPVARAAPPTLSGPAADSAPVGFIAVMQVHSSGGTVQ
jgi:hypothetical protein